MRSLADNAGMLMFLSIVLLSTCVDVTATQNVTDDKCTGSGAKIRQLMLYNLKRSDPGTIAAVNKLFQQRLTECDGLLYPGSSYGGPALSTSPTVYGFPPSRPMPVTATIADWVGWMDFGSLDDVWQCLAINNQTGTLQAMRAYAQPNGRFGMISDKHTISGNQDEPCPFPDSYAPATVRYVYAYLLRPGVNKTNACRNGISLWHSILRRSSSDVRHGTGCNLLEDEEAWRYDLRLGVGFGGYVDFTTMRDMTRLLASNNPTMQRQLTKLRTLAYYAVRAAVALPWTAR